MNEKLSKKQIADWWRIHRSGPFPIRTTRGVFDAGGVIRIGKEGVDIVGAPFMIRDHFIEQFPFPMHAVDAFSFECPELRSLVNCPVYVKTRAQFGSVTNPMNHMDTLIGCPKRTTSLVVNTLAVMENLESSLEGTVGDLSVATPKFASFAGLEVPVNTLTLIGHQQESFKGIHKHIKQVAILYVGVAKEFVGVLPFVMLDAGIQVHPDASSHPPDQFSEAVTMVNALRKQGKNIHEIQEDLIDAGLGKYAHL